MEGHSLHVGFSVGEFALEYISLPLLRCFPSVAIPSKLRIQIPSSVTNAIQSRSKYLKWYFAEPRISAKLEHKFLKKISLQCLKSDTCLKVFGLTPGYNPKTFKQHDDHCGSLHLQVILYYYYYYYYYLSRFCRVFNNRAPETINPGYTVYVIYYYYYYLHHYYKSRDSLVGIATRLRAGRSRIRLLPETRDFSALKNLHTGSGAYPAPCTMPTGLLSLE
jgi:hypothetical protein